MNRLYHPSLIILTPVVAALFVVAPVFAGGKKAPHAPSGAPGGGTTVMVPATAETAPVPHAGDAADDPAIWVHPTDPSLSTIIGTDKRGGLAVYDLSGKQLQYLADGRINNVDLRANFTLGGQAVALVAATNTSDDSIAVYRINPATRHLENAAARRISSEMRAAGLCMYRSPTTGKYYVFGTSKGGAVEQWELFDDGRGRVDGRKVRTFFVASQTEGCAVDDEGGHLYLAEERVGIWKYGAEPDAGETRTQVDSTGPDGHLTADVEGLAIYDAGNGTGYLIASSQGNNSFVVYRREAGNAYVETFAIGAGRGIDAVEHTDGIDVTSAPLGPSFPQGLFVAQNGRNDGGNQNFTLVSWDAIAKAMGPALLAGPASPHPRMQRTGPGVAAPPVAVAQRSSPTFGRLKVGQVVKAKGEPAAAQAMVARKIEIEPESKREKLKGRIDAISARDNSLVVLGVKLVAAPGAVIMDSEGRELPLSALRTGWAVKVKATGTCDDGRVQAREIKVLEDLSADDAQVRGRIQALDAERQRLTVMGLTINVSSATRIVFD